MTRRVSNAASPLIACVREIQSRRVCREWSLEGIDSGRNLSSLGMTILLSLVLGGWMGCRVRVAMSLTSASMLAVHVGGSYLLVDPVRTVCNLFEAADYLASALPSVPCDVRANVLVEVRVGLKWQSGLVKSVDRARGQFTVQLLQRGSVTVCSVHAHTWRRVTDDTSDLDREVVRGLKRAREGSVSV